MSIHEQLQPEDIMEVQKTELSSHIQAGEYIVPLIGEVVDHRTYRDWLGNPMRGVLLQGRLEKVGYVISNTDAPVVIENQTKLYAVGVLKLDVERQGKRLQEVLGESRTITPVSEPANEGNPEARERILGWRVHEQTIPSRWVSQVMNGDL